jgi:hypothetical protein
VAADGDPVFAGGIQQTVSGLTVGDTYTLTFDWAGAQQTGFAGNTTEKWQVTFGLQTQSTATNSLNSNSFNGWNSAGAGNMTFTATSSSQLLTFLAVGSPSGEPPWLLLNNLDLEDATNITPTVPEPGTFALLGLGVLACIPAARRLRKNAR